MQNQYFNTAFNVIFTVIAGVVGTAAIVSVYAGRIRYPDEPTSRTTISKFWATTSLLVSACCFFLFYQFAKQSNEICLLFFAIGNFLFFRTFTTLAAAITDSEREQAIWESMSQAEREDWLDRKQKTAEATSAFNNLLAEINMDSKARKAEDKALNKKLKQDLRVIKRRAFINKWKLKTAISLKFLAGYPESRTS